MQSELKLSALEGYVIIDGDTASVMNDEGLVIQVSMEEWETLREQFRLDDVVDYEIGKTPMTGYQFRAGVELSRKLKSLEVEKERLLSENKQMIVAIEALKEA